MRNTKLYGKLIYKLLDYYNRIIQFLRRIKWYILGANIHKTAYFHKIYVTWPHQVKVGKNCILEPNIYFKFDGIWQEGPSIIIKNNSFIGFGVEFNVKEKVIIGENCLIASHVKFVDHDHGLSLNDLMKNQLCPTEKIEIGDNVWIGANAVILKGVTIGSGAVIAAGAIVNKSIPANEIWGGVPAKKISER